MKKTVKKTKLSVKPEPLTIDVYLKEKLLHN